MKKVKLKLKFDELNAIYSDLFNNVHVGRSERTYESKLLTATLTELYMKIAPKVMFTVDQKITLTLTIAHASALFIHIHNEHRDASRYLDNVYLKIATHIDQQIA